MNNQRYNVIKTVSFEFGSIELLEEGILIYEPHPGVDSYTMPHLEKMLAILLDLSDGTPMPYFANNNNLKKMGHDERGYVMQHMPKFASAFAMTEDSYITRFIHHTFMQIYHPPFPVKLFKEKSEAIQWLKQYTK